MNAAAQTAIDRMKALMDAYWSTFGTESSIPTRVQDILDQYEADSAAELEAMHRNALDFTVSGVGRAA